MTRQDYWNRFNARQRAVEKKFARPVYLAVKKQYISFLNAVKSQGYEQAKKNIDRIVTPTGVVKVLKRLYRYSAWIEGNHVGSSLIKAGFRKKEMEIKRLPTTVDASFSLGFDEIAGVVDEYFRIYQLNISGLPISETTKRNIVDHLFAQVDSGVDTETAVRNFRELALVGGPKQSSLSRSRTVRILQTESGRAMSFGGLIGAYKSGVDVDKVWVTSGDERVRGQMTRARYPHTALDGQTTSLFGTFQNGEAIKFPGDPDASAANTVNCRCTNFYKKKARPRPRIPNRTLSKFLTDFFLGFVINVDIGNLVESLTEQE